jgi:hypothetical protein
MNTTSGFRRQSNSDEVDTTVQGMRARPPLAGRGCLVAAFLSAKPATAIARENADRSLDSAQVVPSQPLVYFIKAEAFCARLDERFARTVGYGGGVVDHRRDLADAAVDDHKVVGGVHANSPQRQIAGQIGVLYS